VDVFDAGARNARSILRARRRAGLATPPSGGPVRLPAADGSVGAVFLVFAAHEVRRPSARRRLFDEVARVLRPHGAALLVEHVRDVANALAFGPGALHFAAAATWRRCARDAGLAIDVERRVTPFVRVLRLRRR
jgi:hypothetical protein